MKTVFPGRAFRQPASSVPAFPLLPCWICHWCRVSLRLPTRISKPNRRSSASFSIWIPRRRPRAVQVIRRASGAGRSRNQRTPDADKLAAAGVSVDKHRATRQKFPAACALLVPILRSRSWYWCCPSSRTRALALTACRPRASRVCSSTRNNGCTVS
jgi:hypothetical protein